MATRGFRSKTLRRIYDETLQQGWAPRERTGNGHFYVQCPERGCTFSAPFSVTANEHPRNSQNVLRDLRRHGFVWEGRKAVHEPIVNRHSTQERLTSSD